MEVVDIDLDTIPVDDKPVSFNIESDEKPSVSFGSGIELLMNEKKKSSSTSTKIDLDELDNLESELNDLSSTTPTNYGGSSSPAPAATESKTLSGLGGFGGLGNMFGLGKKTEPQPQPQSSSSGLGQGTKDTYDGGAKTWDGFSKMKEEVPKAPRSSANLTEREKRRKKRIMIKKLEEWAEKGTYKHGSVFTMDSDFDEVEDEYEGALEEKRKKDSVKLQGWWFSTVINTLEYGNALLNPFDLNLDGWGEQVNEDLDSYEEIFAELYEKYKGGKMAPEVSLLLRIGFSAAVVNMSNKMLSTATPGFNDVIKQSPDLMKMFSNAAVETMSKENVAFDFAKNLMSNQPEQVNTRHGPPPAPVETKNQAPPQRPGSMQYTAHPGNRPDLAAAGPSQSNSAMFRESGVDLTQNQQSATGPSQGIPTAAPQKRPEMRGPQINSDIDSLLSGLKPKTQPQPVFEEPVTQQGAESIISISSLKDLDGTTMPKKSKKRHNSSNRSNTVSLDI
jgi:hypothetical protein